MDFVGLKITGAVLGVLALYGVYKRVWPKVQGYWYQVNSVDDLLKLASTVKDKADSVIATKMKELETAIADEAYIKDLKVRLQAELDKAKAAADKIKELF